MSRDEQAIEDEIREKGLVAHRLSPEAIDACIASEQYHVFPGTTVTVCCLTLRNGFSVVGESACVSKANFDEELGRKVARGKARDRIWEVEGYRLRQDLWNQDLAQPQSA